MRFYPASAEAWTPYRRHIRCLEGFHISCLQRIPGVTWKDKIPHTDILQRTNSSSMETTLARRQLRWVGHVIRMPSLRLPQQVLYGQIYAANRWPGGQKRRYKDHLKGNLKSCGINPGVLETTAANRQAWSSACDLGIQQIELQCAQHRAVLHQRRHQHAQPQPHPSQTQHSHVSTMAGHVAPGLGFTATFNGTADSSGCLNIQTTHPRSDVIFEIDGLHKKKRSVCVCVCVCVLAKQRSWPFYSKAF